MKAMILAAGLGTRLLPLTKRKPKPLFPILGQPLLDHLVGRLQDAGCEAVIINTHHLAHMIDEFVRGKDYGIPVQTRYEPTILGTGGGIKNVASFLGEAPFLVINGDIFTDIDFKEVYEFHLSHEHPATLVLHDCPRYNTVWVGSNDDVTGFGEASPCPPAGLDSQPGTAKPVAPTKTDRLRTFTGIQVLDPQVLGFIPVKTPCSMIHVYCEMIRSGMAIKGFMPQNHYWHDIGTLDGYQGAAREALAREALQIQSPLIEGGPLVWSSLKGDGSDRIWYRVSLKGASVILVDHGLPPGDDTCEADSFFAIGRHLHEMAVPVPRIYGYDRPSGLIALEDLGDLHLQAVVRRTGDQKKVAALYRRVIDSLIIMGVEGAKGFNPAFAYQTPRYDKGLILDTESRYFVEAFLNGYRGLGIEFHDLKEEFELLAEMALENGYTGFIHRDFQSRNIIVRGNRHYVIDFQGGRLGPLAYDIASLLIDPYAGLSQQLQADLLSYHVTRLQEFLPIDPADFLHGYKYCAINRNLQILGAFAFLSQVKGKGEFRSYIPEALKSLKHNVQQVEPTACKALKHILERL